MNLQTALSTETRRAIVELLASKGQLSASEISDHFPLTPSAISQHLKILKEANIVTVEKRNQQRLYEVNEATLQNLAAWAAQMSQRYERFNTILIKEKDPNA